MTEINNISSSFSNFTNFNTQPNVNSNLSQQERIKSPVAQTKEKHPMLKSPLLSIILGITTIAGGITSVIFSRKVGDTKHLLELANIDLEGNKEILAFTKRTKDEYFEQLKKSMKEYKHFVQEHNKNMSDANRIISDRDVQIFQLIKKHEEELKSTSQKHNEVITSAFNVLENIGVKAIKPFLNHENPDFAIRAIKTLGKIGKSEQVDDLIKPLLLKENSEIAATAIETIGKIGGAKHIDLLIPFINKEKHPTNVVESAIDALGNISKGSANKTHIKLLMPFLEEVKESGGIFMSTSRSRSASNTIIKIGKPENVSLLEPLLHHENPYIVGHTIDVIENMGSQEHIPLIASVVDRNPHHSILLSAASAVEKLGTSEHSQLVASWIDLASNHNIKYCIAKHARALKAKTSTL